MDLYEILRVRSKGFLFLSGVWGGPCSPRVRPRASARVPRRCAIGSVSHGSSAWQAWGIVEDACAKSMVGMHFAWQARDSGCMSALEKELDGGPAWHV